MDPVIDIMRLHVFHPKPASPVVAAIMCVAVLVSPAPADYVVLKNGKRLSGLVRAETDRLVRFETTEGLLLTLTRDRIDHLEVQPSAENNKLSGMLALRKPDFLLATRLLRQAIEMGADPAEVRESIIEASPRFLDRIGYMSNTERDLWFGLCDELSAKEPNDKRWSYLCGEMSLVTSDKEGALHWWRTLDSDYFTSFPKHRLRITRWATNELHKATDERRFADSVDYVQLLSRLDPERARAHEIVSDLGMADDALKSGNGAQACRIYANKVMPLSPEVAKVCLRQALEPECQFLWERKKFSEAERLLKECATPYLPELGPRLLKETYRLHIRQLVSDGQWELARGMLAEAKDIFDQEEAEKLLQECLYAERRAHLSTEDYIGHYKMGIELQEKGMTGAALDSFYRATKSPQVELQKMARERISMLRETEAFDLLTLIMMKMNDFQYIEVLDLVSTFREKYAKSKYMDQVLALSRTAQQKLRDEKHKSENVAAIRIEQAQRLYYAGQIEQALDLIDGVMHDFPESKAAAGAGKLKQEILRRRLTDQVRPDRPADSASETGAPKPVIPGLDPGLLEQLDEDAFKQEIEAIVKQLQI